MVALAAFARAARSALPIKAGAFRATASRLTALTACRRLARAVQAGKAASEARSFPSPTATRQKRGEPQDHRYRLPTIRAYDRVIRQGAIGGQSRIARVIAEKARGSLDELAQFTGKAKSNLSRTLRTMEGYGLARLERGERGQITPKVMHDRVQLDLPLTLSRKAS